ncbi:MAG: hypothetical protein RIC95_13440 [Vicingaceae bacterium]
MKLSKLIICLIAFLLSSGKAYTQFLELGVNAGLTASRYTVSTNDIGQSVWLRQGELKYSPRIGVQAAIKGIPDKYKSYASRLKHGLMLELSTCKCGGKTEVVTRDVDESFLVTELDYATWQADMAMLYLAKINNTRIILGPTFTFHTYRGVKAGDSPDAEYVYPQGQINQSYVGFELGLGYRVEDFLLSSRYHTNVTAFGKESNQIPAVYNTHQVRMSVSYFLSERRLKSTHRGLYIF